MQGWNQLITGEFSNWTKGISGSYNNGIFSISGTIQNVGVLNLNALNDMNNHVIVLGYTHISGSFPNNIVFNDGYTGYLMENVGIGESTYILETNRSNTIFQISFNNVAVGTSVDFQIRPQMFDLTALFGAGNEPSTVEEFRKLFPADYYPYHPLNDLSDFGYSQVNSWSGGKSIKLSDNAFLDFSGITKGQKTLDNLIKTDSTIQTFTAPNIKDFCIQVVTYFHDNGYDFFMGNVGWSGQDTFRVIYISNVAFIFVTDIYFARYVNASTIWVVKADVTSL